MYLQDGTRDHFMTFVAREFPSMLPRFERLYAKKYPPEAYRKEVKAMVSALQNRYGLREAGGRAGDRRATDRTRPRTAEQVGFAW